MNRNTGAVVAMLLGIIAGIFFISAGFDIMPRNYAFFFGIAAGMLSGGMWAARAYLVEE